MFDLDIACANARARIRRTIARAATRHLLEMRRPAIQQNQTALVLDVGCQYITPGGQILPYHPRHKATVFTNFEGAQWFAEAAEANVPVTIPALSDEPQWLVLSISATPGDYAVNLESVRY